MYIHLFRFLNLGIEEYKNADEDREEKRGEKTEKK